MADPDDSATAQETPQQFEIRKVYLKDVSFEAPRSPEVFTGEWKPETNVQLSSQARRLDDANHEVVLTVTVTSKIDDQTVYLVEVQQAGLFSVKGFEDEQLGSLLGSYCPNLLYAFAREAVADLVSKGGFPQLLLAPVNFDALYAHRLKKAQSQKTATTH